LQKFLAASGVASRRKAEELITAGRVRVNQKTVTELGTKVDPEADLVTVDGKLVSEPEAKSYFLLYKPPGCVTTASDPEGRPTALQYLAGVRARVFPVGRLDYDAEGALLLTDDGELANRLAHPRYGHQRVYLVKVRGAPDPRALERMARGVRLEDGPAHALEVGIHEHAEKNVWIRVVVGEGRYHLVKRLCEAVGLQVQRLYRPEFGGVTVEGLRAGEFRALTPGEVKAMRQRVGLAPGVAAAPPPPRKLPRAARRHGHGPPPVPGSEPAAPPERPARDAAVRADSAERRRPGPRGSGERRASFAGPERAGGSGEPKLTRSGGERRFPRSDRPGSARTSVPPDHMPRKNRSKK
ncbi:MAG TPA: pseudouridine synthase, partial [Anaeromyxobacter sp.]|nr:pseudouridine synthase [Anaeromyxobacter sp.]